MAGAQPAARFQGSDFGLSPSPLAPAEGAGGGGVKGLIRTIKRRQGVFVFTFSLVTGALALNTLRQRIFSPVYEGGFQIQISNPFETAIAGGGENKLESIARQEAKNDVPSLIVLMRSPLLVKPVADRMGVSMNDLISNLSIAPAGNVDQVLGVNLRWRDPAKGRLILNELSKDYTKFSKAQREAALNSGVDFLEQQAPGLRNNVTKLESQLRDFRQKYNVLDPSGLADKIVSNRDELVTKSMALQVEHNELESKLASVQSGRLNWTPSGAPTPIQQLGRQGTVIPGRSDANANRENGAGQTTPNETLDDFEQKLANARAVYKDDSPIVQSILAQRDAILPVVRKQATDAIKAQLFANESQQDELNRQIMLLNENFRSSPALIKKYEDLAANLKSARENYSSFLVARDNYRLLRARSTSPWQVIAPAEFGDVPVEPNLQSNLLRALMLGLISGLGAAILRERTDNVFHTPMETERELQLPVLGLIPYLPLEPGVEISTSIAKMSASERFAIKESLRSLFTTFRLLRADRDIRLIAVTSSTQGEGKSTAVSIFARTLADLGLKVLVVDADMRLPMQTRYLGLAQGEGFSTLLTDSSVPLKSLIQPIQDNLDILPAGPKPPDPAKLLNSSRAQEIVNDIRDLTEYDMVLFDAPPCLMLADPILLGEKLDGILFLVGLGKVSRELAPQACRRIKATGVDVLGLICNQVNFPSRLNDYGYEYGYYYHYAYANASGYSSTYGKYGKGLGRYARGVGSYVRRYRDSYLTDRYIRDGSGAAVQRYHDEGVSRELRQSKLNSGNGSDPVNGTDPRDQADHSDRSNRPDGGSNNPPTSGGGGWLKKLPFRR
ncbi:MAG: polysaccharide biosynthesis tyrosine autokinase [Cyanobacteria bacterium]|nr:polysaccharide biosynthesis tyrosine autokinase [Cyanobacteriota bacterium]